MPPLTLIQAFELLYTRFILRDFVGKIIPGLIFFFLCFLANQQINEIRRNIAHLRPLELFAIAAAAWLFALCSQSVNSRISHFYFFSPYRKKYKVHHKSSWKLFVWKFRKIQQLLRVLRRPRSWRRTFKGREDTYAAELAKVFDFFMECTSDQKAQYERFVVIKEACANSVFCTLLGLLFFGISSFVNIYTDRPGHIFSPGDIVSGLALAFWLITAQLMKEDNLYRQSRFIDQVKKINKERADKMLDVSSDVHREFFAKIIKDR